LASKYVSSNTEYLLFQNPDAVMSENYLEELVRMLENDKKAGIIQGLEVSCDPKFDVKMLKLGGLIDSLGRGLTVPIRSKKISTTIRVLWVFGAAMLVRRDLFRTLEGFSSELFMYSDEADLCIRALCRGYKCLATTKTSYCHIVGSISSKVSGLTWYLIFRNRWFIVLRYFPLDQLMKACVSLFLEFFINIFRSFNPKERMRPKLMLIAFYEWFKNLKRELKIRRIYRPYRGNYVGFIVDVPLAPQRFSQRKLLNYLQLRSLISK
jgi:GT2 family glycosyltransferase